MNSVHEDARAARARSAYPGISSHELEPEDVAKGLRFGSSDDDPLRRAREILFRQGYDVCQWEDQALVRATRFLWELE